MKVSAATNDTFEGNNTVVRQPRYSRLEEPILLIRPVSKDSPIMRLPINRKTNPIPMAPMMGNGFLIRAKTGIFLTYSCNNSILFSIYLLHRRWRRWWKSSKRIYFSFWSCCDSNWSWKQSKSGTSKIYFSSTKCKLLYQKHSKSATDEKIFNSIQFGLPLSTTKYGASTACRIFKKAKY